MGCFISSDLPFQDEKTHEAIMCANAASPFEILELKSCKCKAKKKPCSRLTCNCLKNGLQCCDFCECGEECENQPENQNEASIDDFDF